ncbi:hypothetical protein [Actinophytocola sp.]|uniref:hypothetical protein n=1 Tax=Actinophytocola sp. TaxID=1872138 RepID=UPI0025C7221E|nr:hypothetical protein [Actinophytocola sp.]
MGRMLDEEKRRTKARKMLSILRRFLGRDDLAGMTVADIGCSADFIADEPGRGGRGEDPRVRHRRAGSGQGAGAVR